MYKFFCNKKEDNHFVLNHELQMHFKVARIKNEEFLINYQNEFYKCIYIFPDRALILEKTNIDNEYPFKIYVALPLIKQSNFEIALQKITELGVSEIYPFVSQYTDKTNLKILDKKERYLKIIKEAAQQSFRNKIPILHELKSFDEIISLPIDNKFLAYEKVKNLPLTDIQKDILFIVGPEGGFNLLEIKKAKEKNVKIVSLTKSILRAETAIIYMLSRLKI
ncbi:16S rRNA (uracil(1498)-N(3))-methyltransferase [Metamycoplasma buccale]|uniref:16S rRNA (uracil(1498)-N(3))-methyltransferase n=1 Tax=Metamycoplasma buccale TaxID=55602 RepID=UPI00398ED0DD